MEKLLRTYCVSPAGRYLGMSLLSCGLAQGLQRSIATRRRASQPGRLEGRSKDEVIPEWRTVRGLSRGAGANGQHFVRARPVKCKFGLEYLGLRVSLHTLADGGSRVVHPSPTTHSEFGCRTQRVGESVISILLVPSLKLSSIRNVTRSNYRNMWMAIFAQFCFVLFNM